VRIPIPSLPTEVIIRLEIGLCRLKEANKTQSESLSLKLAPVEGNSIFGQVGTTVGQQAYSTFQHLDDFDEEHLTQHGSGPSGLH
jgi:hypothetical protein